jgi:hypothetical protein
MAQKLRPFVNHYQDNWSELLPVVDFSGAKTRRVFPPSLWIIIIMVDWQAAVPSRGLKMERQQAQERMQDTWDYAEAGMERAQVPQKAQANKHRREEDYTVFATSMPNTPIYPVPMAMGC